MKIRIGIILLLCLCVGGIPLQPAIAAGGPIPQTTAPEPPVPPSPPIARPPAAPPQPAPPPIPESPQEPPSGSPETKITPQQAAELFRSVDEILEFVSRDTGLPIKHKVKRRLADREQVEHYVESRLKNDQDAKRLQRSALVLKKFGLIPRDFNLQDFLVQLLKEQVAGYYDAKTQTVYLLDWVEPEQQKPVLAHELTHALQDQNFGLEKFSRNTKKDDPTKLEADERLAAREAVIEGQGMIVLMDYMLAPTGTSVAKQPELVDAMQAGLIAAGPGMAVFNHAPRFMQQVLIFPYRYGTLFERDVLVAGGKQRAFAGVLKNPPEDTRQVMQPETYLKGQLVQPLSPLDFGKLAHDYRPWDLSNMGEFDVLLLLEQYTTPELAKDLSTNWRGGYYWAARTPNASKDDGLLTTADLAVVYISRWADADAAERFAGTYAQAVPQRYPGASQIAGPSLPVPREVPAAGMQVSVSPKLAEPATWLTSEGRLTIEPRGNTVLITESLDPETAQHVQDAVFP
jgi:hypothetical protein